MIKQMTSEELKNLILHGNKEIIKEVLENIHPADILDILHEDEDESSSSCKISRIFCMKMKIHQKKS